MAEPWEWIPVWTENILTVRIIDVTISSSRIESTSNERTRGISKRLHPSLGLDPVRNLQEALASFALSFIGCQRTTKSHSNYLQNATRTRWDGKPNMEIVQTNVSRSWLCSAENTPLQISKVQGGAGNFSDRRLLDYCHCGRKSRCRI